MSITSRSTKAMQLFRHCFGQDEPNRLKKFLKFQRFFIMHQAYFRGTIKKNMFKLRSVHCKIKNAVDNSKKL